MSGTPFTPHRMTAVDRRFIDRFWLAVFFVVIPVAIVTILVLA